MLRRAKDHETLARIYRRLAETVSFLGRIPIVSLTESAMARFELLRAMKLNIGTMDLRIAAVALEEGAIVVTRNARDFRRVPGLDYRGLVLLKSTSGRRARLAAYEVGPAHPNSFRRNSRLFGTPIGATRPRVRPSTSGAPGAGHRGASQATGG
jgi:hypothetical protein